MKDPEGLCTDFSEAACRTPVIGERARRPGASDGPYPENLASRADARLPGAPVSRFLEPGPFSRAQTPVPPETVHNPEIGERAHRPGLNDGPYLGDIPGSLTQRSRHGGDGAGEGRRKSGGGIDSAGEQ